MKTSDDKLMWFKKDLRRVLVDMHIPDWNPVFLSKLDAEDYVDLIQKGGVTSAMIYANSHVGLCYYPTKVGSMHQGLKGRDFFGEIVDLCHSKEISVVAYYSLIFNNYAYVNNPDWRASAHGWYPPGGPKSCNRYGTCCPNSSYKDFALSEVEEICGNYDLEGIFFDMTFWAGVCLCENCKERYKKEKNRDIPQIIKWNDPEWIYFQHTRELWISEFARTMTEKVHQVNNKMTVTHQFSTIMSDWRFGVPSTLANYCDYLSGDFYGDSIQQSIVCKLFHSLSEKKPFEFHTTRCLDLTDHVTTKPLNRILTQALVAPAHGSAFLFIDAINPDGTLNPATYDYTRLIFDTISPYEKEIGGNICSDVALYFSFDSKFNPENNETSVFDFNGSPNDMPHLNALMGAAKALQESHIPFNVITKQNIGDIKKFQVLVLPDVLMMSDSEIDAVRQFVKEGGCLYASYRTSICRTNALNSNEFGLSDVFGVSLKNDKNQGLAFFSPAVDSIKKIFFPQDHMIHQIGQVEVENNGADVLCFCLFPYTDPLIGDIFGNSFSSIHSNPPLLRPNGPAVVCNKYGKGQVIYSIGALEATGNEVNKRFFIGLIEMLQKKTFFFQANMHKSLEMVLFEQPKRKRFLLSIFQTNPDLIGVSLDAQFSVKVPYGCSLTGLSRVPNNETIDYSLEKGNLTANVSGIGTFAVFSISYT